MKAKIPEETCNVIGCKNIISCELTWHHHEPNECNKDHKQVRLKQSTYDFLAKQGSYGESMDDIILRLSRKQKKEVTA